MSKNGVLLRRYTDEFRVEAVRLGESIGGNQAAKRLGIPESSIWNGMRRSRMGKLKAVVPGAVAVKRFSSELEAEIDRLRRELASAKQDLEIVMARGHVEKAAAYFAKEERSEGCRGEICLDQSTRRGAGLGPPVPCGSAVPLAAGFAQWLYTMARSTAE